MLNFKRNRTFLFFLLSLFSPLSLCKTSSQLPNQINQIITQMGNNAHIGVYIKSLSNHKICYSKNANALFTPASVQKVLTTAAALTYLSPSFKFQTNLLMTGKINKQHLNGDVYFKFNGDPSFTDDDLNDMIKKLKSKGIHTINGDVVVDTSAYNSIPYPPGYLWDDLSYEFAAPLRTVIIDDNKFGVSFIPAKTIGKKPTLVTALPLNTVHIENNLKTISKHEKHCPITIYSAAHNEYQINGCLLQKYGEQYRALAIRDPLTVLKAVIKQQLSDNNIRLNGKVKSGSTPDNSKTMETHFSKPLSKLVIHLLKTSDNLYTNTLVKKLGQRYYHTQGTWQNGLRAIAHILKTKMGVNTRTIRINDGAGLSRYNLLSPKSIGQVLQYIYTHPKLKKVFWNALPIAGVDGTLASRLVMFAKGRKLRAKTGTMTSASSLAGFAYTRHERYAFVIMINGYVGKKTPYQRLENKIAKALMQS